MPLKALWKIPHALGELGEYKYGDVAYTHEELC